MVHVSRALICALFAIAFTANAQSFPANCTISTTAESQYLTCPIPGVPNAPLVLYAHGYVASSEPIGLPLSQFVLPSSNGPLPLPMLINSLGYAFAAAAYPKNGLAIQEGMADTRALLNLYKTHVGVPAKTFVAGVSEGALIAAKLIEEHPTEFDGGLALCGPIGDFRMQINHMGDFRAVYDYFFRGVMPGTAIDFTVPPGRTWADYQAAIIQHGLNKPEALTQVYSVTQTPVDPSDSTNSAVHLLWYSFNATEDANATLGGNPYDNRLRWYTGSSNDFQLNWKIKRYAADQAALDEIAAHYQTSGTLPKPLVTMHNTGDHLVPYSHASLYGAKVQLNGSLQNYAHLPILRYGHCAFEPAEIVFGFVTMVNKSGGAVGLADAALPDERQRARFVELQKSFSGAER